MDTNPENNKMEIGKAGLKNLNISRKWAMFLAIIGFIFFGLFIVIGIIAGTFLSAFNIGDSGIGIPDSLMFIFFPVLIVICFLPLLFLFRFSKHTSKAVLTLENQELHKAIRYLKLYFIYLGVLLIFVLVFYIAALILTGTSMAFLKGL